VYVELSAFSLQLSATIVNKKCHPGRLCEAEEIRDPIRIFSLDPGYSFTPFRIPG